MAVNSAFRLQGRLTVFLLLALLQAAGRAPADCAAAPRRALTGTPHAHSTQVHRPVSQAWSRTLLDRAEAAVINGSDDGPRGGNSSNMTSSAGIVAGVFLGLTLLGAVAGCMLVRMCAGTPIEVVATAPASAAEGHKGDKAQEIPVLTGLRISQPDGTFVCAIDSAPSADLDVGGGGRCCTAACSRADSDQPGCNGCGCSTVAKV